MKTALLLAACLLGGQFTDLNPFVMQAQPTIVLHRPEVQRELKLSGDQIKAISDLYKESMSVGSQHAANDPTVMMNAMNQYGENEHKMLDLLSDDQKTRYEQIHYQMLGTISLSEPPVQKALALTREQIASVGAIRDQASGDYMNSIMHGGHGRGLSNKIKDLSKQEQEKLLGLLTPDQQSKFEALLGPPFKNARPKEFYPY